jgi:hypothetical protein
MFLKNCYLRVELGLERSQLSCFFSANISSITVSLMFQVFSVLLIQRPATLLVKDKISRASILEYPSLSATERFPLQWLWLRFFLQIGNLPERMEICGQGYDERERSYSTKGNVEVRCYLNSTSKGDCSQRDEDIRKILFFVQECFVKLALNLSPRCCAENSDYLKWFFLNPFLHQHWVACDPFLGYLSILWGLFATCFRCILF